MTNEVTVFTTPADLGSMDVRLSKVDGNTVWRLDDVCRVLEIANPWNVARRLDEDETTTLRIVEVSPSGIEQTRNVTFVTEAGLYSLILLSRSPRAKALKRWVTHKVLPAIRKDGAYIMGEEKVRNGRASPRWSPNAIDLSQEQGGAYPGGARPARQGEDCAYRGDRSGVGCTSWRIPPPVNTFTAMSNSMPQALKVGQETRHSLHP
jgi:prophage antirepressor-like protein